LDLYSGSGGFSLNALKGGAKRLGFISFTIFDLSSVTIVESSLTAIRTIQQNLTINGFPQFTSCSLESVLPLTPSRSISIYHEDVDRFLKHHLSSVQESEDNPLYDLVICDPPKLAPSLKSVPRAKTK
jgi:23S rRNA G2069 N7-methylase RlmK/C1962 C5-methylase RlmI